ncbi:MAG: cobalt-precorrin-5B (C(1))-methyltransferase CbiD [Thermodesulfobacteriota bacterium]
MSARRRLRTGFSTGSAAAAAAKAALLTMLGRPPAGRVSIPLPGGDRLGVGLESCQRLTGGRARAVVIKDAGDDPDVTNGAAIAATLERMPGGGVAIAGGSGVGVVTRPGLPVAVGEAAINPVPRAMIAAALAEAWALVGDGRALHARATISVARGQELARRTLNPRLGIVGGISILGTSGLVRPMSHEAYTATIESALSVAMAAGLTEVVLATGGRSEKRAMAIRPDLPAQAFVQIADFFGFALERAAALGFAVVGLVSYFGKAVKQAQGLICTHAHRADMDLAPLAQWLAAAGAPPELCAQVAAANTARHALEMLIAAGRSELAAVVGPRLIEAARGLMGPGPGLWAAVLDAEGGLLYRGHQEGA